MNGYNGTVGGRDELDTIGRGQLCHVNGIANIEFRDVGLDGIRDVQGKTLDLDFAQLVIEEAAFDDEGWRLAGLVGLSRLLSVLF